MIRAAEANPRIVGLTADLGKYTDIHLFANRFPERFFQIGMAEQNLIGVAAGLSRTGFIPFATTYCVFASRRAYDFIAIGAALGQRKCEDHCRPAGFNHRLWRYPPGHRRPGLDALHT